MSWQPWKSKPTAAITLIAFAWSTLHPAMAWAGQPSAEISAMPGQEAAIANEAVDPAPAVETQPKRAETPSVDSGGSDQAVQEVTPSAPGEVAAPSLPPLSPVNLPKGNDGVSPQAIALPSGGGSVSGMGESFSAQLTTGIATLNLPFATPAGRGNIGGSFGLIYSSSGGYGLAGVGWSMVGPVAIARQTDRGLPGYDDRADWHPEQDRFVFGAQELVPLCKVAGASCAGLQAGEQLPTWANGWQLFRTRVEGTFMRFFWSPDHRTWRVQSKSGVNLELGAPLDSGATPYLGGLETHPNQAGEIYRWHLVRQYTTHGAVDSAQPKPVNVAHYRYLKNGGLNYLSDVFHTTPAASPVVSGSPSSSELASFAHRVRFTYEARPDTSTSYRAGFAQEQRLRLARVDVTSKPFNSATAPRQLVRRYHLDYDPGRHASRLSAVQLEGRCSSPIAENASGALPATSCPRLPKQSFRYQDVTGPQAPLTDAAGKTFERFNETIHSFATSAPHSLDESNTTLMDVNADSLPDVLVTAPAIFSGKHGLFLGGHDGDLSFAPVEKMDVAGVSAVSPNVLKLSNANVRGLDLDGNAQADLVHMPMAKQYSVFSPERVAGKWIWQGREVTTAAGLNPKIDFTNHSGRIRVMDVNGDGLVDVVFSSAQELQTFFALGRYPGGDGRFGHGSWTSATTANLSDDPLTACIPWSAQPVHFDDSDVRVADLNGDGLPDIARVRSGQLFYWPGRGNGFWGTGDKSNCQGGSFGQGRHVAMQNPPNFQVAKQGTLELADVNADGLADLVEIRFDAVDIYLNVNGQAWTKRQVLSKVPIKPNTGNIARLVDIDGSGTLDIVWGQGYNYRYIDLAGGVRPNILVASENGLGKTTELAYSTSSKLMLAAEKAGKPWAKKMPLTVPVVTRVTVKDNLDTIGRAPGTYVTEYRYRDPVFDGRQREFRGFSQAETRTLGDTNSPSSTTRSTFLLGECQAAAGFDVCSPAERWKDNFREPLKGLPVLVESFDDSGVYLSTAHTTYELRQLYSGRDGRRVSAAFTVKSESLAYDTANFGTATAAVALDEVVIKIAGVSETQQRNVTPRSGGAVRLRSRQVVDNFGNPTKAIAEGCVEGCAQSDEVITTHTSFGQPPGHTSGWLFVPLTSFITGSVQTEERGRTTFEYDSTGDLLRSKARLSGTLPLDRFHETSGAAVAPPPPGASGGTSAPLDITLMEIQRDVFGNAIATRSAEDRCRAVAFDPDYRMLPVSESVFAGERGSDGCGTRVLTTTAEYDRGFALVTLAVDATNQPAKIDYDGFGRITQKTFPDPKNPGQLSALPSETYTYLVPQDATVAPYSRLITKTQDGTDETSTETFEQHAFIDGLGRPLAVLSEADPSKGDGGDWVVSGITHFDKKGAPLRAYESAFHSGTPQAFNLGATPTTDSTSQQYDAFGRSIAVFGLDGQMKSRAVYHALSQDMWDAEDLSPGAHQGTFATVKADGHGRNVRTTERIRIGGVMHLRETLRDYLPSGEVTRITQRAPGAADTVRWMRYDSLGRLVLNVEPNTTENFNPNPATPAASLKAYRYAYNDAGDLVGTSDARGCGVNYHFDAAGRMLAEDYSPCKAHQETYTPLNPTTSAGAEVVNRYDLADPETPFIQDASGKTFQVDTTLLTGRLVSIADRGQKMLTRYDSRGRVTGAATKLGRPGGSFPDDPTTYAPRWYIQERVLDAADRTTQLSTGATTTELLGASGKSEVSSTFSRRGVVSSVSSSYGVLTASQKFAADGLMTSAIFGDEANTQRAYSYDQQRRLRSVQTFRAGPSLWTSAGYTPATELTQQLLLEDCDYKYDEVNNITEVKDWRLPSEWPTGAKPVNRTFEYDDLYRLTRVRYEHTGSSAGGSGTGQGDAWTSPFEAENTQADKGPKPSPHVDFTERVKEQRYAYDHLGNTTKTSDDQNGFFDRSLGNVSNGTPAAGPHQLTGASNRATSPSSTRKGDLLVSYDPAGNMERMIVKRDGACLPSGASCWQRFSYEWDELGRLAKAQRWDLAVGSERTNHAQLTTTNPTRAPDVELRYLYDSSGQRTVKTAVDPTDNQRHTAYVFPTLELRSAEWKTATNALAPDYELTKNTENVLLPGAGARARVIYSETDLPSQSSGKRRLFLELGDHLGSTTFVIDHDTGELVEHSAYMAYGATDSDYRPDRWDNFREPYKFSGKEEDVEVGLVYFGARYLVPGLGRWASADPVTVHQFRADPNPYAYVAGRPLVAIDPNGNEPITLGVVLTAIAVGAVVGAVAGGVVNAGWQWYDKGKFSAIDWGAVGIAAGAGAIGGAVGGPIAGPLVGGWTGAIVGGAAGSGTGYLAHVGLSGSKFTWKGFGLSVALGAVAGGLFYGATRLLTPRAGPAAGAGKGKPAAAATPKAAPSTPAPAAPPANAGAADDFLPADPIDLYKLPPEWSGPPPRAPPAAGVPKSAPTPPRANPADIPDNLCGEACWAARRAVRPQSALKGAQLKQHLRQLEKYGAGGYKQLPDGRIRYYGQLRGARQPGEMAGRRLVREWNPGANSTRSWHETLDHAGRVRIVRPQTTGSKIHYIFDANGKLIGTR